MDGVSTPVVLLLFTVAALLQIGLGYLVGRQAARKGYSLGLFWLCATFFVIPTIVVVALLNDRTARA